MSNVYIRRETYRKLLKNDVDVQEFVNEAVQEKLSREGGNGGEQ